MQPAPAAAPADIVAADHLSKWYGQVIGLNDVTLTVPAGITGLLGPNGAGKSTFMKLITGQLRPTTGRLSVYLRCLTYLQSLRQETVSSAELAARFHLNSAQIRKDLACFGEFGTRGVGFLSVCGSVTPEAEALEVGAL